MNANTDELNRLGAEFTRTATETSSYAFSATASARAKDPAGVVEVLLDDSGLTVRIVEGWERRVPAEELGQAITAARAEAIQKRFDPEALRSGQLEDLRPPSFDGMADLAALSTRKEFLALMRSDDFGARIDHLIAAVRNRAAALLEARGPQGIATVRASYSGEIASIEIDAEQAAGRAAAVVQRDIQTAIDQVAAGAGRLRSGEASLSPDEVLNLLSESPVGPVEGESR